MANADKKETTLAFLLIVIYVVLMSAADVVSAQIGIEKAVTAPLALVLTAALFIPIRAKGMAGVGITAVRGKPSAYLYFIPLAVLASVNLWNGVTMNYSTGETVLYIISMICAGFLFTIIFHRSKSLVPCIITHCVLNSLSAFAVEGSTAFRISVSAAMTVVSVAYAVSP